MRTAKQMPVEPIAPPASTPEIGAADQGAKRARTSHLSESVSLRHWVRLLVVVATFLLLTAAVGVTIRLMMYIEHTLLLFALGGLFAYAFDPIVEWVRGAYTRGRRPRWVGVTVVFVGLILILIVAFVSFGRETIRQVSILQSQHVSFAQRARERLADVDVWLAAHHVNVDLEQYVANPPQGLKDFSQNAAKDALKAVEGVSKSIVESIIVLLIALYFLIYNEEMHAGLQQACPDWLRPYTEQWQRDVNRILGGFVRGQLLLATIMGSAAAIGCLLIGIHFWLLIGIFVVFASLIPVFGPYIGAIPAIVAAALSAHNAHVTPGIRVILVIILFVVLNEGGSKILYPRLVGAALGLHEVLVLFVLFAGLEFGGIWGVLFAAPVTALVLVTLTQLYRLWEGEPPISVAEKAEVGGEEAVARGTP